MTAAADEGRSRERLNVVSQSMVRREAYAMIPSARREGLLSKGLVTWGGIQPRDRLQEETQRLADAGELREERARHARIAAAAAREQSWGAVMQGNRESKTAREAKRQSSVANGNRISGMSARRMGGIVGGTDATSDAKRRVGGSHNSALASNRLVFFGSLAGNQLVHELIEFAIMVSGEGRFGAGSRVGSGPRAAHSGNGIGDGHDGVGCRGHGRVNGQPPPTREWDPVAATRGTAERLTHSRADVRGSLAAAMAAAPDSIILGVPGIAAVLEEAKVGVSPRCALCGAAGLFAGVEVQNRHLPSSVTLIVN